MHFKSKDVKLLSSSQNHEVHSKKTKGIPFSILGNQTFFHGKLILKGEARLAGQVEGSIVAEDILIIEEGANIKGDIQGNIVEICGLFEGNLTVTDTLKVTSTARVLGEINAAKLVIEEGAKIKGQVNSTDTPKVGTEVPNVKH